MSNRDYANRKPRKSGKARTTSRKATAAPKRFPIILAIAVTVIVVGFGYFLWHLKSATPESVAVPEVKVVQPVVKKDPNALPPKPKEEWTYLETLENKKVEIDLPKETKPTRPYQMQCGSFKVKSQAEEMKAIIAFQGLSAQIRHQGSWFKVVLGPYERKRVAERERHKLQAAGMNGCQIWFWEG